MDNLKYFTDENGNIFIQAPNNQRRNRVTNVFDDKTGELITWNVEEIKDEISKCILKLSLWETLFHKQRI